MALSKNKLKYIQSLKEKKGRKEHKTFVAEGDKMVSELLGCMKCQILVATQSFILSQKRNIEVEETVEVDASELKRISFVKNPQNALAVFYQPEYDVENLYIDDRLSLALDEVQDPGNLGTIVRIADWYGIENIFCSRNSADIYNPKTVQATMGAIARVKVHYVDLEEFLKSKQDIPVYGTFLDGENMYQKKLTSNGIIVMGNEGNGISPVMEKHITEKLFIPNYPANRITSESLNVSVATAIICAEFRRKLF
ncbi:RNA methyltransferase [Dysgonomonas sp. 520]|uniref:RNA methyltransferase n=1 Tax=Dysgonomonas sp. 520 TaxID=2302931 RepID=UPI0013D01BB4|nr:RNA methyltransferase [Dysgonomonas sp. 520]NDW09198.1 RNA methyltransferase [Dysgonomonas sp. 520]